MNGHIVDNVACGGCHTLLTATRGSNADFTNNDFSITKDETRPISLTELPPLQKVPTMNKTEEIPQTIEDVKNSNISEPIAADHVNGNANDDTGSIDSLEANVSGSHVVNINDLDNENGSTHDMTDVVKDDTSFMAPTKAEVAGMVDIMGTMMHNAKDTMTETVNNATDKMKESVNNATDKMKETVDNTKDKIKETVNDATDKMKEKAEMVEETITKSIAMTPKVVGETKKVLDIPDKVMEVTNSPPPKTPILPELLQVPDLSYISPISKHSDDGQKSETGQSENETIPCGSDKSSPQAKTKTQAVMPIVRSDDQIDGQEIGEEGDVVVKEKGRFARFFQTIKDKENSCMSRGKVIEENVVGKSMFI